MNATSKQKPDVRTMAYVALCAALMAVCSWISIPTAIPFTMQTFAAGLIGCLLGPQASFLAVLVYILLGAVGVPVFSGFTGGIGILLGTTGGYIVGFLLMAPAISWLVGRFGDSIPALVLSMLAGNVICYVFGTAWFMLVYARTTGPIGLMTALGWCVFPYILPGLAKVALATVLARRLRPVMNL